MSGIVVKDALPFSRTFFEKVPLQFINLDELVKGSLEDRRFAGDAYWQIDSEDIPQAYLILRGGRPYRIIGYSGPSVNAFMNWLRKDKRELTLTYRFMEHNSLPYLLRCCTEEPVLQDLDNDTGDIMDVLRALRRKEESGLLRIRALGQSTLVPVEKGKLQMAFGPGSILKGKAILTYLTEQLPPKAVADLYPGQTAEPAGVGISEAQLLVSSFNNWLEAARPTWPECANIASTVFKTLKQKEECLSSFSYDVEDGLFLEALPAETEKIPSVFANIVRTMCRKHPSPGACNKLFLSSNKHSKLALEAMGIASLLEGGQ